MKRNEKLFLLLMIAILTFALAACGSSGGKDNPPTDGDTTDLDNTDTDTATDGDLTEDESTEAEETAEDEAETEADTDADTPPTCTVGSVNLPLNYACNKNSECASGVCYFFDLGYELPYGVCTHACTAPARKAEEACPDTMTCEEQETDKFYCTPKKGSDKKPIIGPGDGSLNRYESCWGDSDCGSQICWGFSDSSSTWFCSVDCGTDATVCGECGTCQEFTLETGKAKRCVPKGTGAAGVACSYELDCASDLCFPGSSQYCSATCDTAVADACPTGLTCKAVNDTTNLCLKNEDIDTPVGSACSYNYECVTSTCLQSSTENTYCSQECTPSNTKDAAACPEGLTCTTIEGLGSYCLLNADTNRPTGTACDSSANFQCAGGVCFDIDDATSYCTESCSQATRKVQGSCPADFNCAPVAETTNYCLKTADSSAAFGDECAENWQCESGICYAGACNQTCTYTLPERKTPIGCPADNTCEMVKDQFLCFPNTSLGQADEGQACTYDHECKPGLFCKDLGQEMTDTALFLYASDATTDLANNSDIDLDAGNLFSKLTYTFATAGTYYIAVKSEWGSGDYLLTATRALPAGRKILPTEVEPNNDQATATTLEIPGVIKGTLESKTDVDYYKFEALAGDVLTFETGYIINPPVQCAAIPTCPAATPIATLPATLEGTLTGDSAINFRGCTGYNEAGPEAAYALAMTAGESVHIRVSSTSTSDLSIGVGLNCYSCTTGTDSFEGNVNHEDMLFTAPLTATYWIVVDSTEAAASPIPFKLEITTDLATECSQSSYPATGCCLDATTRSTCDRFGYLHSESCGGDAPSCAFTPGILWLPPEYSCTTSDADQTDPDGIYPRDCPVMPNRR